MVELFDYITEQRFVTFRRGDMDTLEYIDAFTGLLEEMKLRGTTAVPVSKENRHFLRKLYQLGTPPSTGKSPGRPVPTPPPPAPETTVAPQPPAPKPVADIPRPSFAPPKATPSPTPTESVRPAFQPTATLDTSPMGWDELERTAMACKACSLCTGRKNVVFESGNRQADLMFIGEGPGQEEDEQGIPFVGKAGQLLTKIIGAMGLSRDDVYIANIIKCRPPNNRNPQPEEADACIHFLKRQIELVNPKVIVLLGAVPLQYLMNIRGIMRSRGTWLTLNTIPVMPTYHPSFLLRKPENKRAVWDDMQQVMAQLGKPPQGQA